MIVTSLAFSCIFLSIISNVLSNVYVYDQSNKQLEEYDDQTAAFGPSFVTSGLKGFIIATNPQNACTQIAYAPNLTLSGYHWIALISRTKPNDSCDFDLKVQNAQNANFSAVIVYNYEDQLFSMGTHGRVIDIPSTMISHTDGKALISRYLYNTTSSNTTAMYHVKIISDKPFNIGAYFVPFAAAIAVLILCLLGFMFVKCYLQRRRTRRHRLPRSALKQLKKKKFVKGDRWEVCAICLDDYVEGAKLRILPCDHAYHVKCIDPWLVNNRRQCPVCKRYVFPHQDNSDEENRNHQQTRTSSEQTPLLRPADNHLTTEQSTHRSLREQRRVNLLSTDRPHVSFVTNESSDSDNDTFSLSRPVTINNRITTDPAVGRVSSRARRYRHRPLPRQSSTNENDAAVSTYGSVNDASAVAFTTHRAADFFVGSFGGTTDSTNVSARSMAEDLSDTDAIDGSDNGEERRVHLVLTSSESNPAYVNDDESASSLIRSRV